VDGLLRNLTATQFRGWEHFYELEPDPEIRADYRAASIVQILYNINRGKSQKALTLEEALLKFGEQEQKQKQTPEQQFSILKVLAAMHANDTPEGPRSNEEQQVVEEQAAQQLAMIEQARKAMH
jgi:hypothetical protein